MACVFAFDGYSTTGLFISFVKLPSRGGGSLAIYLSLGLCERDGGGGGCPACSRRPKPRLAFGMQRCVSTIE